MRFSCKEIIQHELFCFVLFWVWQHIDAIHAKIKRTQNDHKVGSIHKQAQTYISSTCGWAKYRGGDSKKTQGPYSNMCRTSITHLENFLQAPIAGCGNEASYGKNIMTLFTISYKGTCSLGGPGPGLSKFQYHILQFQNIILYVQEP